MEFAADICSDCGLKATLRALDFGQLSLMSVDEALNSSRGRTAIGTALRLHFLLDRDLAVQHFDKLADHLAPPCEAAIEHTHD